MCISPRSLVSSSKIFADPPKSCNAIASFTSRYPLILGAVDLIILLYMSGSLLNSKISFSSSSLSDNSSNSCSNGSM